MTSRDLRSEHLGPQKKIFTSVIVATILTRESGSLLTQTYRKDKTLIHVLEVLRHIDDRVSRLCKDVAFVSSSMAEASISSFFNKLL